ncbi:MAG: hypothetical protein HOG03_14720 [Desulfobacula sp.]|uniref:hypothetical protein n=1 Tax=Desulfobacula sp. TaxID=2593537 RepID=UPI001D6C574B|nr:hypothetical protein [Desulfobacula sp.]MBT3484712.1 hypothetical protein [Desulfobacula sp.]MBT3805832.1 hypothetical protein [Desulfobacula sp.]MBT4026226.1 hypothetical protein [Desulfobacula sp.]MBT4200013.1 hypothetical protein [Desulfobacula sp.]
MTGISEILVLVLLIACILILPRLFKGESAKKISPGIKLRKLSTKKRFCIVLTLIYPIATGLYLKPWNENLISYISFGIIPVCLAWAVFWIFAGKK